MYEEEAGLKRAIIIWTALTVSGLLLPQISFGGSILSIRNWTAPDHTRIVLDISAYPTYRISEDGSSTCLIVELKDTSYPTALETVKIGDALVRELRFKRKSGRVLGIIVELAAPAKSKVFALKKYLDKPYRLVIDVLNPQQIFWLEQAKKAAQTAKVKGNKIVAIDPGHGGEDPGAIGRRLKIKEKDIVLAIAQKLYSLMDAQSGITPCLTRTGDYYVPLNRRIQIASHNRADLFVSIHANANRDSSYKGSSVYYLSEKGASDKAAMLLAQRENAADLIGGDVWAADRTTNAVLFELSQTSTRKESLIFAKGIIKHFDPLKQITTDQDIRSAPFAVLKSLHIPSVLVETAFITNYNEEKLLASDKFQDKVAGSLAAAICDYLLDSSRPRFHVVKKGETLWRIARQYGIDTQQIKSWNHLDQSDIIIPGQKLRVGF
jgi:N-acetylmuramoyl-L-alanine amidase